MNERVGFVVWVISEASGEWERYTVRPFLTQGAAARWAKKYLRTTQWAVHPA